MTAKPERNPDSCVDCGVTDATAVFTQQATVLGRLKRWLVCGRCLLKRGATPCS